MYETRLPLYQAAADYTVVGGVGPEKIARQIIGLAGVDGDIDEDMAVINPSRARGVVSAPPSKSLAHRSLICAALADGESTVTNVDFSQDILATLDCIKTLGAEVAVEGNTVKIKGAAGMAGSAAVFNCRESGSTLRFFIPMAIQFCDSAVFNGSKTLISRPQSIYEELCKSNRIDFERSEEKISINTNGAKLKAGTYTLEGNISSQFITGLLFVLPLLDGDSQISLIPPVESRPYIDLTLQAMADFGVKAEWKNETTLAIAGNQKYQARKIAVEGDYSNAAFLDVFNFLGGDVKVNGLYDHSLQGDRVYRQMFKALAQGCPTLDISDCPDLGPVLFALAALLNGGTFNGTKRLAIKESDRGKIMCEELAKFGVKTQQSENQIIVKKGILTSPSQKLLGHNDHRIVMALATMLTVTGGIITDAHAVKKSFPGYFDVIKSLGIDVTRK